MTPAMPMGASARSVSTLTANTTVLPEMCDASGHAGQIGITDVDDTAQADSLVEEAGRHGTVVVEQVPGVEDGGPVHARSRRREVHVPELLPLGGDDEHVRAGTGLERARANVDPAEGRG